ncbi:hypothetical protein SBRCBS47491_006617 [Sporothrix bragantina]|uniref:Uncharacterized protein n=1 Tax=Sporothrix bragantina TaxID=671064 RepID=A0ABP0C6D4_9PEZI
MVTAIQGFWYNYAEKRILDATVTLSLKYAGYLIAGLSTAVTLAGSSFWSICAFILHSNLARRQQDVTALHLQHQVTLVNSGSAISAMTDGAKTMMAWWSRGIRCIFWRTISFILPPFIVWAGFVAAGVFVANVATTSYGSTVVRVKPDNCGFVTVATSSLQSLSAYGTKVLNDTYQARAYMANFYQNRTSSAAAAEPIFVTAALPYTTDAAAACPVPDVTLCTPGHNGAFSLTSLPIDSQTMLGINAKKDERVTLTMSTTCSPLDHTGFVSVVNDPETNLTEALYFLGPLNNNISNFTYSYADQLVNTSVAYLLDTVYSYGANASAGAWTPIPQLARDDADLALLFFSQNSAKYFGPVFDPFFLANGTFTEPFDNGLLYKPNAFVQTMICADQYTLCNPNTNTCTPTGGLLTMRKTALAQNTPGFNATQYATATRIVNAVTHAGTYNSVNGLGAAALFATNQLSQRVSQALPDTQWQTEVAGWFGTSLAKVQAAIVEFAVNGQNLGPYMYVDSPYAGTTSTDAFDKAVNQALQNQCTAQLVQLTGFMQNFSFLGIMVVACVTVFLFVMSLSLGTIVDKIGHNGPARTARQTDHRFHLLRMAMGSPSGPGNAWESRAFDVPVLTQGTERFARPAPVADPNTELASYACAAPLLPAVHRVNGAGGIGSGP